MKFTQNTIILDIKRTDAYFDFTVMVFLFYFCV